MTHPDRRRIRGEQPRRDDSHPIDDDIIFKSGADGRRAQPALCSRSMSIGHNRAVVTVRTRNLLAWIVVCAALGFPAACRGSEPAAGPAEQHRATAKAQPQDADRGPRRDLAADEAMGGHTLARHVGRTDTQLADRLRSERQISAASTYTDRATAERAVGAALAASARELNLWENRSGRRPNLVLHHADRGGQPLGRSLSRGQIHPVPAFRALVVMRWDERARRAYVLTSYPEADR